jgi:hypothetical protein
MKNAVFWDINTQFVLQRGHIKSPLESPAGKCYVRFEVFTAVTVKNVVFWDVRRVVLVRTDVSEERIASIIKMTGICELGTLAVIISCSYCLCCS